MAVAAGDIASICFCDSVFWLAEKWQGRSPSHPSHSTLYENVSSTCSPKHAVYSHIHAYENCIRCPPAKCTKSCPVGEWQKSLQHLHLAELETSDSLHQLTTLSPLMSTDSLGPSRRASAACRTFTAMVTDLATAKRSFFWTMLSNICQICQNVDMSISYRMISCRNLFEVNDHKKTHPASVELAPQTTGGQASKLQLIQVVVQPQKRNNMSMSKKNTRCTKLSSDKQHVTKLTRCH